jgi:hypothetical protein
VGGYELNSCGERYDSVAGSCENNNELSGSIRKGEILDQLSDSQQLNSNLAP